MCDEKGADSKLSSPFLYVAIEVSLVASAYITNLLFNR
jgi:hypothetical protein